MRVLIFGAGPLGSLYAHLLQQAGSAVTLLARGTRHDWLKENGLILVDEMTGEESRSRVDLIDRLTPGDHFDLAIVLVRKNKLAPVCKDLAGCSGISNILFMGNNALGLDDYLEYLPRQKLLFGFPNAGGGFRGQVVHYADRETPKGKRRAVVIGEIGGERSERLLEIKELFQSAGFPVDTPANIDGWLKYHVALVSPLVGALYRHNCNNYELSKDKEALRLLVRAANEGARVLEELGFKESEPPQFKLMKWMPEFLSIMALKKMLESKFAEIAFAMHARSARDEMMQLSREFEALRKLTSIKTPNIHALVQDYGLSGQAQRPGR